MKTSQEEQRQNLPNVDLNDHRETIYNPARYALFMADGVLFIFETIHSFNNDEVKAFKDQNGELYLAFGKNILRITKDIMRELKKHRTLFLYELPPDEYAPDSVPIGFEIGEDALGKLEGMVEGERKT